MEGLICYGGGDLHDWGVSSKEVLMKRVVKILSIAALIALLLLTSALPAMALRRPGGVLLERTDMPCYAPENAHGAQSELNPPGRLPGCWVLLPPSAP